MTVNDSLNRCREEFEKWAHSTKRNEIWVVGDKDIAYEAWQVAWGFQQEEIDELYAK